MTSIPAPRATTGARVRRAWPAAVLLAGAALVGCGTADASPARTTAAAEDARTITATATGSASGVPDQLTAYLGVNNQGPSAAAVLAENNKRTQALIAAIKGAGVDPKDVATSSVNLGPTWDNAGKINGYQASNTLRVVLRGLSTAGAKLDKLVKAAGDSARIDGISLGFQDDDGLLSKARADAVKRARSQAEEMAAAAGASVGAVRTIADVESSNYGFRPVSTSGGAASDSAVPIEAGSQEITVQVRVSYELR